MHLFTGFAQEWKVKGTKKRAYMVAGLFFLLLAMVGLVIPILPQIPTAIVAAFLLSKGSTRFHLWTRHNKFFGKPVRDWEDHRIVRTKLKIISTVMMIFGAAFAHWKFELKWALIVDACFLVGMIFIWTRKSSLIPKLHLP